MLTVAEVRTAIEDHVFVSEGTHYRTGEPYRYEHSGWGEWDEYADSDGQTVEVADLGAVEIPDSETGGEGAAEYCYMVFKVTAKDGTVRHFKMTGYYASYSGTEWDGAFSEVHPAEKTITVYE